LHAQPRKSAPRPCWHSPIPSAAPVRKGRASLFSRVGIPPCGALRRSRPNRRESRFA